MSLFSDFHILVTDSFLTLKMYSAPGHVVAPSDVFDLWRYRTVLSYLLSRESL